MGFGHFPRRFSVEIPLRVSLRGFMRGTISRALNFRLNAFRDLGLRV